MKDAKRGGSEHGQRRVPVTARGALTLIKDARRSKQTCLLWAGAHSQSPARITYMLTCLSRSPLEPRPPKKSADVHFVKLERGAGASVIGAPVRYTFRSGSQVSQQSAVRHVVYGLAASLGQL